LLLKDGDMISADLELLASKGNDCFI
jgi:hypothetical protein